MARLARGEVKRICEHVFNIYHDCNAENIVKRCQQAVAAVADHSFVLSPTIINNYYRDFTGSWLYQPRSERTINRAERRSGRRGRRVKISTIDPNMTFGVEIEFISRVHQTEVADALCRAGIVTRVEGYNHVTRDYWKIVGDASVVSHLSTHRYDRIELVSPVLKGKDGVEQIKKAMQVFKELDCRVNKTCGLHVHHGITNFVDDVNMQAVTLMNCVGIYAKKQKELSAMLPVSRRGGADASRYCKPVERKQVFRAINQIGNLNRVSLNNLQYDLYFQDRFHSINIQSFWKYGTVEIRQHSGSVEAEKIINWVIIGQLLVKKSKALAEQGVQAWKCDYKVKPSLWYEIGAGSNIRKYIDQRKETLAVAA